MANTSGTTGADDLRRQTEEAANRGRDLLRTAGEQASRVASTVGEKADSATQAAGSSIRRLGESLKENAPHEGMLGTASQYVAGGLQHSGKYLEEQGLSGMLDDLTGVIRRNPVPAVLIGIGIGFLIGRTLRR
jgi:ElaB/YqjD/DUF883 family membrane-anchored ribosome-binding protein